MDETKKVETPEEKTEDSRREFLSHGMTAVGAAIATGVAAAMFGSDKADAQRPALAQRAPLSASAFRTTALRNGATMKLAGKDLGTLVGAENLAGADLGKAMSVSLTWD